MLNKEMLNREMLDK
jgi:hypothetical protein